MFSETRCSNGHEEVIFDSRFGERPCPVCEAQEAEFKAEDLAFDLRDYIILLTDEKPSPKSENL